jgi:uncharacterized protein (TIGR04255 family)
MGKKLSNAPVYYTVAQVQFNPVLNVDGFVPSIQAKMREAHFSDFKQEVIQRLVLPFGGMDQGQAPAPSFSPQSRYRFGDIEGRNVFVLETNSLSFQTTAYETFEVLSRTMLQGLRIVHDALGLDFVDRIGLRYLDAVQPLNAGESLRDYLVSEVLGLSQQDQGHLQQSISETVSITAAGQLIARVVIRHGQVGLPMELAQLAPSIHPRFTQHESLHAIVDTDAFIANREIFDLDKVEERLCALHDEISKSFKATVTRHAEAVWA